MLLKLKEITQEGKIKKNWSHYTIEKYYGIKNFRKHVSYTKLTFLAF